MSLGTLTKLTLRSCSCPPFNEPFLFSTRLIIIITYTLISQIKQIVFVLLAWMLDSSCMANTFCTWTPVTEPKFLAGRLIGLLGTLFSCALSQGLAKLSSCPGMAGICNPAGLACLPECWGSMYKLPPPVSLFTPQVHLQFPGFLKKTSYENPLLDPTYFICFTDFLMQP